MARDFWIAEGEYDTFGRRPEKTNFYSYIGNKPEENTIHVREVTRESEAKEKLFQWLCAGLAGMFNPGDNVQEMIVEKMESLGLLPEISLPLRSEGK